MKLAAAHNQKAIDEESGFVVAKVNNNEDGRIIYANRTLIRMLELKKEQIK